MTWSATARSRPKKAGWSRTDRLIRGRARSGAMVTRRQIEILTGLITGAFGIAVIVSSIQVGSGWSSAGVESGTFPLLAGILILGGSVVNLARAFVDPPALALRAEELRRVGLLFLPALAFVAAIPFVGL